MSSNTFANHLLTVSTAQKNVAALEPYLKLSGTASNTPATVATLLSSDHDICGLVPVSQTKVLVVHNFMFDTTTPLRPMATGDVFGLTGRGRSPNIVGFTPADLLTKPAPSTGFVVPPVDLLSAAATADDFKAVAEDAATKLITRPLLPVPPLIGYICLQADTQDPGELALLVMKALQDFDSQATPRIAPADAADGWMDPDFEEAQNTDGDTVLVPKVKAAEALGSIAQFLWAINKGSIAPVSPNYFIPDNVDEWASGVVQRALTGGGLPGAPGAPSPAAGSADAAMANLANKIDDLVTLRTKSDSDKKGIGVKAFDEMTPRTQEMILFASGPVLAVSTETGDMVETPRKRPVDSYVELLNTTTSARAQAHVNENLTLVHKCPVNVPLSTVVAMMAGRFLRVNATRPGAWSAFCCFPFNSSATVEADDSTAIALHLKVTEGKGLSEMDVSRSTKIVHSAPVDTDELGYFLTGFGHLTKLAFGESSLTYCAIAEWANHLKDNIQTYKDCQHSDPRFVTRVLARIDHGIQQYLRACAIPESRGTSAKYLEFEQDRMMIERMMFAYPTLPENIVAVLDQRLTSERSGLTTPAATTGGGSGGIGPATNLATRATMLTQDTQLMRFMTSSVNNDGPLWGTVGRPCPHFHSSGVCPRGPNCPWAPSHYYHATGANEQAYIHWMGRCRQKLQERAGGEGRGGRGRGRGGGTGRGGGAGRGRTRTPSPTGSDSGTKQKSAKVQFDDDATSQRTQG